MKNKKGIFIAIIIILVILTFVIITLLNNRYGIVELNFEQVKEKIENKDDFALIISKTECTYCQAYLPKVEKIAKENKLIIYYIEVDKMSKEEDKEFNSVIGYINSTPTTIFIEDGIEKVAANRIHGNVPLDKIIAKLKAYGYIK